MGTRSKWTSLAIVVLAPLIFFLGMRARDAGQTPAAHVAVARLPESAHDERADGRGSPAAESLSEPVSPSDRTDAQPEAPSDARPPARPAGRDAAPSRVAPTLQGFSDEDEALVDRVAIEFESDSGRRDSHESDIGQLNRAFETESRNPSWAVPTEADLAAWMQSSYGPFPGVRVGTPICKASVCMLRAVGPIGLVQAGPGWKPLPQLPMHEPLWRDRFEAGSSFMAVRNSEAIHLTYLYRRCTRDGAC